VSEDDESFPLTDELLLLLLSEDDESFPLTDELLLPVSVAHTINADDITIAATVTATTTFFKLLNFIFYFSYLILESYIFLRKIV